MNFNRTIQLKSPNMHGEDIKALQNILLRKGFDCGEIDGYYGKNTLAAVKLFQKENKLDIDGIVGPKTWGKLFEKNNISNSGIKIVCIDAGHGGKDPGTSFDGIKEKDVVLDVSLEMKRLLENRGINVIITRDSDISLDENTRVNIVNNSNADIVISNHLNSGKGDGCEVFHSVTDSRGKELATKISNNISNDLKIGNRGPKTRVNDKGNDYYFMIRRSKMTALIVEYLFMDRDSNLQLLKNNYKHTVRKLAAAVISSII